MFGSVDRIRQKNYEFYFHISFYFVQKKNLYMVNFGRPKS